MRSVRLTFGSGHALVMATVLVSACGGDTEDSRNTTATGGQVGAGGTVSTGGTSAKNTSTGGTHVGYGGAGTGGVNPEICARPPQSYAWTDCATANGGAPTDYPFTLSPPMTNELCDVQFVVPVAPEGVPPTATELCKSSETPVSAGWSARVTLTESDLRDGTATGRVTLAPELASVNVSAVELSVVEHDAGLGNIDIGTVERQGNVFVFPLTFVNPTYDTARFPRLILTAKVTLDCAGTSKTVVSTTALYRCDVPMNSSAWISSGDACGECAVICEMAASPIVPPVSDAREPLSQAVRAQVTRIGQYGSALLVQAQHDGGADRFTYQWDISAGTILWQDKDLLLWEPPSSSGEHLLQVSLLAADAAAIASSRMRCYPLEGA